MNYCTDKLWNYKRWRQSCRVLWWWCWCQVSWIRVRGVTLHCFILLSSSVTRARHSTLLSLSILFWINKNVWFVIKKSVMRTVMINQNHKILIRISSSYWLNRCDSLHCQCSQRPVYSTGVVLGLWSEVGSLITGETRVLIPTSDHCPMTLVNNAPDMGHWHWSFLMKSRKRLYQEGGTVKRI